MTPYDEDYDGVNEMILVDMKVKVKPSSTCTLTETDLLTQWIELLVTFSC